MGLKVAASRLRVDLTGFMTRPKVAHETEMPVAGPGRLRHEIFFLAGRVHRGIGVIMMIVALWHQ